MKKIIQKYGNALVIRFNKDDVQWYNLKVGDILDLGDIVKIRGKKEVRDAK